ncbi:hypothetical protein pdam_00006820 [Pocillopora damicornis]|uniref:Amyloid-beta A4 protein n=1 Tax=Pocillopora damicornis TaxID=46731 RepID=A0A3M6V415_POCDA|nr:hypothetical protein pdam_00006820 [Pocillopora damicornis]
MDWSYRKTVFLCLTFVTVGNALVENLNDDLDYDPQVAIKCGKVTRHIDVNTGSWEADKNSTSLCAVTMKEILKYCKVIYPSQDVRNVVEGNKQVLVDGSLVTPYRCLVGPFESDALLVPPKCRFEHMHDDSNCLSHDQWHTRASDKCQSEGMIVKDYGVLIPCGTGKFTGVEFVCCPQDASDEKATDAAKIVPISEAAGTSKPTSVMEHLKQEISKFAKHVEESTIGCDRQKYHERRDKLEETHKTRVQSLIDNWRMSEKRYKLLKSTDEDQAAADLETFNKMVSSFEDQVKLERARLKEEHHQCTQIDLNDKKNKAMADFVAALQEEPQDANKILEAVQRYVRFCTQDRLHNLRYFDYVQKHHPGKAEEARESLQNHLKRINNLVNESMVLLYKLPDIARKFQLELPDWIPKPPALPTTEAPTVEKSSAAKDPTDPPSHVGSQPAATNVGAMGKPEHGDDDDEDVVEVEEPYKKKVLVDEDAEGASEKSHLVNMQENGYENPTYRFYDY